MHKNCNKIIRVFSLPVSNNADAYMNEYEDDENSKRDIDENYVVSCGDIVIVKIGYDSDKKPLYKILVGDGARPIKDLGYVAPPNTIPTYDIDEVEEPMCMGEMVRKGVKFTQDSEVVVDDEVCNRFCPSIDDEYYGDGNLDDSMEIIYKDDNRSCTIKEKKDKEGNLLMQTTDIEF